VLGSVGSILALTNAASSNALKVYGSDAGGGDTINAVATGTGNAVSAGVMVLLVCTSYDRTTDVGTWRMINSTASAVAAFTSGTIAGVTIDSSVIGGSTPAAGHFTTLDTTGNFLSDILFTDATYDIGKSGATRPRDIFTSRDVTVGRNFAVAAGTATFTRTTSSAAETQGLNVTDTRTGAGATGWAGKFDLEANVALGAYANGVYGYLALGASGKVTGLGSGSVGEIVLSAGCVDGTYACFEAEMGMPSGAKTGTAASFLYLSLYGADASTFDTNGYLFQLAGVTKNTGKLLADVTTGSTARPVQVLKCLTPDGVRYVPLYSTVAIGA